MPALYSLAVRQLLPEHFAIVGAARSEESDDEFRERMKQAVQEHSRDEFDQEVWDELAAGMHYITLDFADDKGEDELRDTLDGARRGARHRREPRLLLRGPAERDRDDRRRDRAAPRRRGVDPADHREAVRPRPRSRRAS